MSAITLNRTDVNRDGISAGAATSAPSVPGGISVRGVSHFFNARVQAVDEMSFDVAPAEFVAVVGPSGCGKTTMQNIVAGLVPQQSGKVVVNGDIPRAGRRDVAYMFATDALMPWRTVLENVLFGVEIHNSPRRISNEMRDRARRMIASVSLAGFEDAYPRQLSHGMKQRAALARTFLMDSPVLLMDEPFGALDAHTKLTLQNVLLQLWDTSKRTVLFITHDLAEAILLADRVLICTARPGKIKSDIKIDLERPRDIGELQKDERYHHYYQRIWNELQAEMPV